MGEDDEVVRVRMPEEGEVLCKVTKMLGAGRMEAECEDGNTRMVRIPGKYRKRVWTREGDIILVEPWKIESEEKADLVWRYTQTQVGHLKREGILDDLEL